MKRLTLREARQRARMTQEQLEAATGVRQGVISNLETGRVANPSFSLVLRLAKALDIAPENLRFGTDAQEATR